MRTLLITLIATIVAMLALADKDKHRDKDRHHNGHHKHHASIQVGPRPFYLVNDMDESELKDQLESCENGPFKRTDFSIGHRAMTWMQRLH